MARTGRNCRGRNRFVRTGAIVTVPEVVDGKSELAWIKDTFEQVNNGRHPDFTLPRRIDIGLWAALDAFHERAALSSTHCPVCKTKNCIRSRFEAKSSSADLTNLGELDDLRHLHAHNYAGEADDKFFGHRCGETPVVIRSPNPFHPLGSQGNHGPDRPHDGLLSV